MNGHVALSVVIFVLIALAVSGLTLLAGFRLRKRIFNGPARDAWEQTRRGLSRADQWHVMRSTARRRPVRRADLAPAQLLYSRYMQYQAEHSPARRKLFVFSLFAIYLALATQQFLNGATQAGSPYFDYVMGTLFVLLAIMWVVYMPYWLRKAPARSQRLRQQIRERYPYDLPAL